MDIKVRGRRTRKKRTYNDMRDIYKNLGDLFFGSMFCEGMKRGVMYFDLESRMQLMTVDEVFLSYKRRGNLVWFESPDSKPEPSH